jgi:hypothetical protein
MLSFYFNFLLGSFPKKHQLPKEQSKNDDRNLQEQAFFFYFKGIAGVLAKI